MEAEKIITIWRFGYFKLFNTVGLLENDPYIDLEGHEYKQLFWRFYWQIY